MNLIGIEIGGTKLQLVGGDETGYIHDRRRLAVDRAAGGAGIREQIETVLPGLVAAFQPNAVGVGFGGPVDWQTGRICCSHQIEGWHDFELGAWLRQLTRLPVRIDNDANVAALGEALHGAGRSRNPVCWINMGSGVGGGLVVDGRIYHGASPGEAELGHLRLDRSGTTVEQRCSGWAVDRRIVERTAGLAAGTSILADRVRSQETPGGEARHLAEATTAGDSLAIQLITEVADDLAFGLSHAVQLFHPEVIVLGGGLSLIGEPLRAAVEAALPRYVMDSFQPGPQILLAGLGEDSVPVGALALAATS